MEIIEKYSESEFARELEVHLGIIEKPPNIKTFLKAEHSRLSGQDHEVYIPLYQEVADNFPKTKSAYQARFNIAYFYEHDVGDRDKAFELYEKLADETPTVNSEVYVNLAKEKIAYAAQEEKLLEEKKNNIAYYNMVLEGKITDSERFDDSDISSKSEDIISQEIGGEYSGLRKLRARNARIRSRYFTD